jgi:hypothetical protein
MSRILRLAILIGFIVFASECLNLAQSVGQFVQTAIPDWTELVGR